MIDPRPKNFLTSQLAIWILFLVIGAGLTIFIVNEINQSYKSVTVSLNTSSASTVPTLSLSPNSLSVLNNQNFAVNINLDTAGSATDGVDVFSLHFNPAVLQVVDDNSSTSGVQITPGTLFPNTVANIVNNTNGTIQFSQASSGGSSFTGTGTLATIHFRSIANGTSALTLDFTPGATNDTNIASGGQDLLGSVVNSNVTVDSIAPTVSISTPGNNDTVSGSSVSVTATASDNVGVVGVQFSLDGNNLGSESMNAPYSTTWDTTSASNGTHTLTATARDAAGNTTTSTTVTVTVNNQVADTTPPAVSLSAPANNAAVTGSVNVTASASDNVGVASVQFKLDGNNLGSLDTTSPYTISWDTTTTSNGTHTLTALAKDAAGNATTSSSITVTVNNPVADTTPPTVSITAPSNNATVSGSSVSVTANAADNVGVASVQFKLDGNNLGSLDTSAPYTVTWDTTSATNGTHTLTAVARDAAGNSTTSSSVSVTVNNAPSPVASLSVSPSSVATTVGQSIAVNVNLDTAGAAIDGVDIFSLHFNPTVLQVIDDNVSSSGVQIQPGTLLANAVGNLADNTAGTIQFAQEASGGSTFTGSGVLATIHFLAIAAGSSNLTFDFTLGSTTDSNVAAQGIDILAAVNNGLITVAAPADTTPPTVSITSPAGGATVTGSTTVSATASDNVGVVGVQFKLDGVNLATEDTSSPYSMTWDTTAVANGNHTLTASARDAAGNTTTSASVNVTVSNAPAPAPLVGNGTGLLGQYFNSIDLSGSPVVTQTDPTVNFDWGLGSPNASINTDGFSIRWTGQIQAQYTENYTFTTNSDDGVRLWVNGQEIINDWTTHSAKDNISTPIALVAGQKYDIKVEYFDSTFQASVKLSWQSASTPISVVPQTQLYPASVQVADTTPPTVAITAPLANASVSGNSVSVTATASDNVGVTSVQFKLDGVNLGSLDNVSPFNTTWNATAASNGTHTLTAVAMDAAGNTTTSSSVTVTVNNADTTPPTVAITAPASGASVSGNSVSVTANAADNIGVASVQFKLDGSNLGSLDTTSPFTTIWNTTSISNGTHTLTAVAMDAAGNTTTSATISVTVNNADTTPPTVAITAPSNNATVSGAAVSLTATAADNIGVVGVQFKLDGANLGAEDTTAPYTATWNTTSVSNGTHTLTAVARDAAANTMTSAAIIVTVNNVVADTTAPTVSITAPTTGSTVSGSVTVSAAAADNVGVAGVQFKLDGVNLGTEDTTSPYSVSWDTTSASNATHTLTAVARDAASNTTTSAAVSVTVNNVAPSQLVGGATLALSPTTVSTTSGQSFAMNINLNTASEATDGVDVFSLHFNPAVLQVVDDNSTTSGVQITPGSLLPNTVANTANNTTGLIQFSQASSGGSTFTGSGVLAMIHFQAIASGTSNITFDYTAGATNDSNVAHSGQDLLSGVTNAAVTVTGGAVANQLPIGSFDGVNADGITLHGWAYDPDSASGATTIQVFVNGAADTGTMISSAATSILRSDVNATKGITGNHGFEFAIPTQYRDGASHTYYVYAIDLNDSTKSTLLTGSPQSFTVAAQLASGGGGGGGAGSASSSSGSTSGGGGGGGGGSVATGNGSGSGSTGSTATSAASSVTSLAYNNIHLVYEGPTFFVIINGQRYGVTNPGLLYSYGLEFKDATAETAAQNQLPYVDNLKPGDGALVKKDGDTTVWLIADGTKHGFTSADVFAGLGYNFGQVLTVTANELDALSIGDALSDATQAHRTGTFINQDGTIYRISQGTKQGIPSIEVYNSYNTDNDFSHVVTANAADRALPVGAILQLRQTK